MASTYKVLAQSFPAAVTLTEVYDVPDGSTAVISTIVVCNRGSTQTSFRISIQIDNAADDESQYLYYDTPIPGNDTFVATLGITLGADDRINVYAGAEQLSFNIFGAEIT